MKLLKSFLALFAVLAGGLNFVKAADLVIDEYMSTFNGQYSYNVLMTNEDVWHWKIAKTPNSDGQNYPQWGGYSKSIWPMSVTSDESLSEGSVRVTVEASFKMERSSYPFCDVTTMVGTTPLYIDGQSDYKARITSSNYATVDATLVFVSYGLVSGPVKVAVNPNNSERDGTFTLKSIKVERTDLVPPTVESDQPNPAEAPFTLTVTNNDPDAELYWTYYQSNPFSGGSTPAAITSGFTKTYDNDYQNNFYAYAKRDGFYSVFVGGTYEKKVVRNIQYSRNGGYFLNTTLPSSVVVTCDDLKEGDQLFYKKGKDTDWTAISSGTTIYISENDADNYNSWYKVAIYTKVVNASGMESEVKNLYFALVSVPDVSFNGYCNSDNWYEKEFNGPQIMTLGYSTYEVEGLALEYSYDGETWHRYNGNNRPVISSTKVVYGRVVYSSNGEAVGYYSRSLNYIINSAKVTGTCTKNYYTDMPFDVTIGSTSYVNTYVAYTLDGSDPRTSETAVEVRGEEQTIQIAESCTLKMAVNQSGSWNDVVAKTMSIQLYQPMFHLKKSHLVSYGNGDIGTDYDWLHNETSLSQKKNPYYSVDYDSQIGTWYTMNGGSTYFFGKRGQLGECTFDVHGDVDTDGDNNYDTYYGTHMVVTVLEQWNAHDSIDFNSTNQAVFTTYEANGCTWQTDANGKYLLVPQGATITVSAPDGINLSGVFLNGGNNEENISHLRQTVEGCYVSHVPVNDWYCKWIGRRHSVTFVADAEQRIYGIESFYYLTPSDIYINYDYEVIEGKTMQPYSFENPHNLPITYSSSDTSIATVDPSTGVVTAIAPGLCTITAEFAGDGVYAPFKENYQIQVVPDVSTIKFMGQELKNVQETATGEIGGGTWTFTWEEEEVQEYNGGEYVSAPMKRVPSRSVNGVTIVQIPVLTLNNVSYTGEGPVIEVNDYSEFRIRLIGQNSLTMTNNVPAIAIGTYNGANSSGASVLITDEDGVWETESSGGYEPVSAPRRVKKRANGTGGAAKLTIAGGPMGIYVCNGNLFIADCEVNASGSGYGVFFTDYYEQESGSGELSKKAPKKVLPTSYWASYFQINDNAKLKLQGEEAALFGRFSDNYFETSFSPELKACDLEDAEFYYYWGNDDYKYYSYMTYDDATSSYTYAKLLQFGNDYFTANTIEGVKMKFWPIDEDEMTCQVGYYNEQSDILIIAIDQQTSGSVTIPSEANGYQVNSISGGAFYGCNYISTVSIPASVESIGVMAFGDCYTLNQVTCYATVPPTLEVQGEGENIYRPFTGIDKGAILYVPAESLEDYQESEWNNCFCEIRPIGGEGFIFTANTPEGVPMKFQVLDADDKTAQVYGYYDNNSYQSCPAVSQSTTGTVTVPAEVLCSDNGETYYVTTLSECAFGECTTLTSVVLSEGVQTIGYCAFYACQRMTSLVIPSTIKKIEGYALQYCYSLKSVIIYAEDPEDIGLDDEAFYDMNANSPILFVPTGCVEAYQESAWAGYFTIKAIGGEGYIFTANTPEGVPMTFMVTNAEEGNYTVQTYGYWSDGYAETAIPSNYNGPITIPETVTYEDVTYAVTGIGEESFDAYNLSLALTEVTLPSTITYIGGYAFDESSTITKMTVFATTPPSLANDSPLSLAGNAVLYVPAGCLAVYEASDWANYFSTIVEMGDAPVVPADINGDGVVTIADVTSLVNIILGKGEQNPAADINGDGVVTIADVTSLVNIILGKN